ncbi:hypothetical protein [Actinopolymorpha alba]|uniref:hypothetical protein n=1 Tax=Actinopolymorpha alba TaxID=533267 RepID=UPI00036F6C96|nr:hypothetical protein [Actinopolymorpha alba]
MKVGLTRKALLLASAGLLALSAGASAASAVTPTSVTDSASCTDVPNRYNQPFSVCDDELFIFAVNYKPFESSVTPERTAERVFDTLIGNKLRENFPEVKIKYATWDYPVRYEDLQKAGVVPDIIIEDPRTSIDRDLEPRDLVQDMTGMIQQGGLDLSTLN